MVELQTLTLILECVASACLSMSKHRHDILPAMSQLILLLTLPSPGIMMCSLRILVVSALNCQSGVSGFKSCWVLLLDKVLSISNFFFREYESDGSRGQSFLYLSTSRVWDSLLFEALVQCIYPWCLHLENNGKTHKKKQKTNCV